jgi:YggT family protein
MHSDKTVGIDKKRTVYQDDDGSVVEHESRSITQDDSVPARNIAQQLIYFVLTIINGLIVVRFILSLFGANRANTFADTIYTLSSPFVSPFRSLFSVDSRVGETGGRFEIESIVAIIVYSLLAWILIRAFAVGSRDGDTV